MELLAEINEMTEWKRRGDFQGGCL